MDISKLEVGMVVKNYKELCELLGENQKGGNSKKSHLIDMERYFKYTKIKHSFVIDDILEKPLEKIDGGIYSNLIQKAIIDLLISEKSNGNEGIFLTTNDLLIALNMVNYNYKTGMFDYNKLSKELDMKTKDIKEFYMTTDSKLKSSIESAMKRLSSKLVIDYNIVTVVCVRDEDTGMKVLRKATDFERKYIIDTKNSILKDYNYESMSSVILKGEWDDFISIVNDKTKEEMGIFYSYKCYDIVFSNKIEDESLFINNYIQNNNIDVKEVLNKTIVDAHKQSYIDRHEDAKIKLKDIKPEYNTFVLNDRANQTYVEKGHTLIDTCIDLDSKIIE